MSFTERRQAIERDSNIPSDEVQVFLDAYAQAAGETVDHFNAYAQMEGETEFDKYNELDEDGFNFPHIETDDNFQLPAEIARLQADMNEYILDRYEQLLEATATEGKEFVY